MIHGPHELRKLLKDLEEDQKEVRNRRTIECYEIVRSEIDELIKDLEEEGFGQ